MKGDKQTICRGQTHCMQGTNTMYAGGTNTVYAGGQTHCLQGGQTHCLLGGQTQCMQGDKHTVGRGTNTLYAGGTNKDYVGGSYQLWKLPQLLMFFFIESFPYHLCNLEDFDSGLKVNFSNSHCVVE